MATASPVHRLLLIGTAAFFSFLAICTGGGVAFAQALPTVTLAPIPNQTVTQGQSVTFAASAVDSDPAASITYVFGSSATSTTASATLNPSTGMFSWNTTNVPPGVYTLYVIAYGSTGGGQAMQPVTVTINPANSTAPRQVIFIHGLIESVVDVENEEGSFGSLISALPANERNFLPYYQDKGYQLQGGGCGAQPAPDIDVGSLYAHSTSINPSICDSQSAIAYNATRLDDQLSKLSPPATVVAYSMGAAIARGWLTLAQSKPNDTTLHTVDTLITLQGAQQGSYLAGSGAALAASASSWSSPIWDTVISAMDALLPWNIYRPAITDLAPSSSWYQSVNPTNVPSSLHYFNFYSNIQATVYPQLFFITLPPLGTISFGDDVLLPGDPNPTAMPLSGGARFLPGGSPTTDRHEYEIASVHDILLGNDVLSSLLNAGSAVSGIINDPISHLNLNQHLDDSHYEVNSCVAGIGQITIQDEILRILHDPAHACSD